MRSPAEQIGTGALFKGYSALTTLCSPLAAAVLLCSARGRIRLSERFGSWGELGELAWWFHGASVGEVQGLIPILSRIRSQEPSSALLLTATSPTGLTRGAQYADSLRLLPLDASWCVRRAIDHLETRRLVVCETELWPVLLHQVARRNIPAYVVNGRISDYTVRWYERASSLIRPIVASFRSICVPSSAQRERYLSLGAHPDQVVVTGHSKYDTEPRIDSDQARLELRAQLFPHADKDSPIVVLGSVRPGEEHWWLEAFAEQKRRGAALKLIVAPRHAERFSYFAERIAALQLPFRRWSDSAQGHEGDVDLLLLDTMGKLEEVYSLADLAFVGATLVDVGGHNPMEPAMYGAPVVVGPHIAVIRDIIEEMRAHAAVLEETNGAGIAALLDRVVRRDPQLVDIGRAGHAVWQQHRGASQRILAVLGDA